ncbi:MAG TPA: hypothetical protein VIW26_09880 [Gemmatimonadales bacterium]
MTTALRWLSHDPAALKKRCSTQAIWDWMCYATYVRNKQYARFFSGGERVDRRFLPEGDVLRLHFGDAHFPTLGQAHDVPSCREQLSKINRPPPAPEEAMLWDALRTRVTPNESGCSARTRAAARPRS